MREAALITGGAKRIGKEIALLLSILGFDIALHYSRSKLDAIRTAQQIQSQGAECSLFACDLSNLNQTKSLIARVQKRFPHLAILVNNASLFEKSSFVPLDLKSLQSHMQVNFFAPAVLSAEFTRICKKGLIINILDTHITSQKSSYPDYLLSKKALANFTQMAAVQFAPNIRVNAIAPGLILPPEGKKNDYLERLAKKVPLKKVGSPSQIALTIQFLVENEYLTGQTIFVDGGEHLLS